MCCLTHQNPFSRITGSSKTTAKVVKSLQSHIIHPHFFHFSTLFARFSPPICSDFEIIKLIKRPFTYLRLQFQFHTLTKIKTQFATSDAVGGGGEFAFHSFHMLL